MTDERLGRWIQSLLATPGLTAIRDPDEAWRVHVEQSLAAVPVVERYEGPIVDVGSGGGAPGLPLAAALPDREVTLLESNGRKAAFLERLRPSSRTSAWCAAGRRSTPRTPIGVAVAKALAPPAVAAELCLPLVRIGGAAVLYVGPSADADVVGVVAGKLGGARSSSIRGCWSSPKIAPTPPGFPRRAGMAAKRPLA